MVFHLQPLGFSGVNMAFRCIRAHGRRCDLRSTLLSGRRLLLQELEPLAADLFLALRAMKAIRIVHTDIKPENLLMSLDKKSLKLSDFGCAPERDPALFI